MKRPPQTLDHNGHPLFWWGALPAIPADVDSDAYRRLQRIWFDHTRFQEPPGTDQRYHGFVRRSHETNLTVTLWENFVLFPAGLWIPRLLATASLPALPSPPIRCRWSYEWEQRVQDDQGKSRGRMCDVVIEYELEDESRWVIVVEAKNLVKGIGPKELDTRYYLDIPQIAAYEDRRTLLFLLDDACCAAAHALHEAHPDRVGVITWQQLGGLQVELAQQLDCAPILRSFIAGAIQYQYANHDILPTNLAAAYLKDELSVPDMDSLPKEHKQGMGVHVEPRWRLDE